VASTRRRRRKSTISRFVQDVVDDTRDVVDDLIGRSRGVEDDVRSAARRVVDDDEKLSKADLRELRKAVLVLRVRVDELAAAGNPA
jgi:hypothetical protein